MKSENTLDQLLGDTSQVDTPNADVLLAARNVVTAEAEVTAARAAKIVRMRRRHRRLTIGVAAAAVAGLVAVPLLSGGHNTSTPTATPSSHAGTHQAPVVQEHFRTAAQVINAAAANTSSVDPTAAPYWKVESKYGGGDPCVDTHGVTGSPIPKVAGAPSKRHIAKTFHTVCLPNNGTRTTWTTTDGKGTSVLEDSQFGAERPSLGPGTIIIDGQTLTWRQFNARTWTNAQLAAIVIYPGTADVPGYASRSWYSLKDAFDFMAESPLSSTIRKQTWKIVEHIQGVQLVGQVTDHAGRTGWEIRLVDPNEGTMSFIIDTQTGTLLESITKIGTGKPYYWTYLSAGPSDTAPTPLEYVPGKGLVNPKK